MNVLSSGDLAGYIDPAADHIRYVRVTSQVRNVVISFADETGSFHGRTESEALVDYSGAGIPPILPMPLNFWLSNPIFRTQPQDLLLRPGTNAQFHAIFHRPGVLDPQVSLNLPYQWQKLDPTGEWLDVSGATNTTLSFDPVELQHAGSYRLRATVDCLAEYSRVATLSIRGPEMHAELAPGGILKLAVTLPVAATGVLQSSADLKTWHDEAQLTTATNQWNLEVAIDHDAKFYQMIESQ